MNLCRVETKLQGRKGEKPHIDRCNKPATEYRYTQLRLPDGKLRSVELCFCAACAARYDRGKIKVKEPTPVETAPSTPRNYVQYSGE